MCEKAGPVPAPVMGACLNHGFNHEIKTLITVAFFSDYLNPHSAVDIRDILAEAQSKNPTPPGTLDQIASHCQNSLGYRGARLLSPAVWNEKTGSTIAWKANPQDYMGKLALAGFTSEWSLTYPKLSLQDILGRQGTGVLRYKILGNILRSKEALSAAELASLIAGVEYGQITPQVRELTRLGIIERHPSPKDKRAIQLFFAPGVKKPFKALHKGIQDIRQGIKLESYTEVATSLLSRPVAIRKLIKKGLTALPYLNKSKTEQEILEILSAGACRSSDIDVALGRCMSASSLNYVLSGLVQAGKISREVPPPNERGKGASYIYRL